MIYNMDCGDFLRNCKDYDCIVADPPDCIGLDYDVFKDTMPDNVYLEWMTQLILQSMLKAPVVWWCYNAKWDIGLKERVSWLTRRVKPSWSMRTFIWRFTFGQHVVTDCGNGYRPILRFASPSWVPDCEAIKVESARQRLGDKRAAEGGRVPDDVWEFPRIVGNSHERRAWHPTQLREGLVERMIRMSWRGGRVLDLFGGTGTTLRVCKRIGVPCDICEISPGYCSQISKELHEDVSSI